MNSYFFKIEYGMKSVKRPFSISLAVGHFVVFLLFEHLVGRKCVGCDNLVGGALVNWTTCGRDVCFLGGSLQRWDVS